MSTILLIILIVLLIGCLPTWPHSRSWGYAPGGVLGFVLIIILILFLLGNSSDSTMLYTYESIGKRPRIFEIDQAMKDAPLTIHPKLGIPIHRVVTGGSGFKKSSCKSVNRLSLDDCKQSKHYNPNKRLTVAAGGI